MSNKSGYIGRNPGDGNSAIVRQTYSLTSETTELSFTAGYIVGFLDVYLNGVKLIDTQDYEATNASTVTLTTAAPSGDVIEVVAYKALNVGSVTNANGNFTVAGNTTLSGTVSVASTATLSGVTTCEGDLYVGGDLYVLDDIVYDEVSGRNLNITGIATAAVIHAGAGATVLSSGNAEFVGIVTSNTCFKVGNGAFGAGIGATITGDGNAVFAGVVTATTFKGDGSALTGVAATDNINTNNIQVSGITTLGSIRGDIQIDGSAVGVTSVTWDASADSLIFKDGSYAKFGDGSDLSIYHDGSNSYIRDNGTGALKIGSDELLIQIPDYTETMAAFTPNASVDLYYNNAKRFNTDTAGSYTTGIHTASQSLHAGTTVQLDGGTGVVTATSYKGDGSALTGVGGEFDITSCLFI